MARYIEFDSTYRNRNEWPEPSEFDLIMSQTGKKDKSTAVDPVCVSAPILNWTSNAFDEAKSGTSASIRVSIDTTASTPTVLVVSDFGVGIELQDIDGYYNGAILADALIPTVERRILDYKYIGTTASTRRGVITLESSLPVPLAASYFILDPTDTTTDPNSPYVFVPNGSPGNNAYFSWYLYNESDNTYRVINFYDATTKIVSVDATVGVTWADGDVFDIRKELPVIVGDVSSATLNSVIITSPPTVGSFSSVSNFYKGDFIRVRDTNEARRITSYDGTNMFVVSPAFDTLPAGVVEILPFSYDNFNPFVYTGSQVSQQENVCYELELLDLVLPNQILDSEQGSRIAFYPYVYVELVNLSSSSAGNKNILYSNNPNSVNMLWRVAIDDISNQTSTSFIKNDCDGSCQTVKFKPNDNLHFSVRLSNGELFKTVLEESYSPYKPNPLIQISGMFSMKRM